MRLDIVTQSRFPPRDTARFGGGVREIDQMTFAGVVPVERNNGETSAATFSQRHEPRGIGLFDNQLIRIRGGPDNMSKDLRRAMIFIHAHVKKTLAVLTPDDRPVSFMNDVRTVDAVAERTRANGIEF